MRSNHKGFTLIESLLSLCLITTMLSLYLPGIIQSHVTLNTAKITTQRWQLLAEITMIYTGGLALDQAKAHIDQIIQRYSLIYDTRPPAYDLTPTYVRLNFEDQVLEVSLLE